VALKGLDIAGQAQTGTGKTMAFLIPIMQRLLKNKPLEPGVPRALIVTPTRELALQIHEDALVLAGATSLRQALVIGGIEYREQAELLGTAPEIVICTPGRIIDYLQQGVFKTKGVEVAVVDEADRLLDMGFIKDLKYLLGKLPPYSHRQTMLFSATLDERVLELTYQFMNPPQFITAEPDKSTKLKIEQALYHVGREEKLSLLMGLLRREPHRRVIIFSNTKSGVEWLSKKLTGNGFQAEGITGDLPQPKRLRLMEAFKENRLQILVATDVASRGIHVEDVSHVYNYDLPQDAENYVHRIGRTARAGREGKAVSFGCEDYVFHLEAIENLLGEKIPVFWADNEWFQTDVGGEVSLKDRRSRKVREGGGRSEGRDGGRDGRGGPPRPSGRPPARVAARSQRPGGIFGLAPRLSEGLDEDERRRLGWAAEEAVKEAAPEEETASEEGGREGRRRRRRRGRRGREGSSEQPQAGPLRTEQPQAEQFQAEQPRAEQPRAEQVQADQPQAEPLQAKQPQAEPAEPAAAVKAPKAPRASRSRRQPKAAPAQDAEAEGQPPTTPARGRRLQAVPAKAESPAEAAEAGAAPPARKNRRKTAADQPPEAARSRAKKSESPDEKPAKQPRAEQPRAEQPQAEPKRARRPAAEGAPRRPRKTKAEQPPAESPPTTPEK
jgi:ATP-dependent RNA helicase RhlB